MEPVFGWTLLSPDAIRRAEARLREDARGVRDEIGFLFLHQAYADRFFPGTSVQQTRLRYALFVPWIYQKVAALDTQRRRTFVAMESGTIMPAIPCWATIPNAVSANNAKVLISPCPHRGKRFE